MDTTSVHPVSPSAAVNAGLARVAIAAERMYAAELALHAARQADVDSWVAAAYDRLHDAIAEHCAASLVNLAA